MFTISKWLGSKVRKKLPHVPVCTLYNVLPEKCLSEKENEVEMQIKHPSVSIITNLSIYAKISGLRKIVKTVKNMPHVNFYIAGDGRHRKSVENLFPSNAHFLGFLPKSQIRGLLKRTDVYIHPMSYEAGLSWAIVEATLMGKPVIASNVGGLKEIIIDSQTGLLCEVQTENAWKRWIEKITFLLENPEIGEKMNESAKKWIRKIFDGERISRIFLRQLQKLETS